MRCSKCRKPISSIERKKAKVVKDEAGRISGIFHKKCFYVAEREAEDHGALIGGRYLPGAPDAYDMAVLNRRQQEIEEQKALEKRPEQWNDWRDTAETEI